MLDKLRSLLKARMASAHEAQGFVEYALIMAGVSAATQVAMQNMGQQVADVFNSLGDALKSS
jgi:Flp pilus assembly pilin Flp